MSTGRKALAPRVTRGAILYYLVAVVALHLVETGLDPVQRPISSYLNTDWRPLATTTFFALSLAVGSSLFWLRRGIRPGALRAAASVVFAIVSAGIILAGLTPTGLSPLSRTLHGVGGVLTFPPLLLGTWLWTVALYRNREKDGRGSSEWHRVGLPLLAAGMVLAFIVGVTYGEAVDAGGAFQRALFVCLVGWLWLASGQRLGRDRTHPPARGAEDLGVPR